MTRGVLTVRHTLCLAMFAALVSAALDGAQLAHYHATSNTAVVEPPLNWHRTFLTIVVALSAAPLWWALGWAPRTVSAKPRRAAASLRSAPAAGILLWGCLILALQTADAAAATYYVRMTGNNTNAGTSPALAWRTIAKAATTMVAGDTVYVGAGVYNNEVLPTNDGTAVNPIRFIADTTGAMTGDAGNVDSTRRFHVNTDNYIQVIGFRIRNALAEGVRWTSSTGGVLQDCEIYSNPTQGVFADGSTLSIVNCYIHNNTSEGLYVNGTSTVTVTDSESEVNGTSGTYTNSAGSNLTLLQCRINSNVAYGVYCNLGTVTLENCLIASNQNHGLYVQAAGVVVTAWNNTIARNVQSGVRQDNGTLTLKNSIVAFNQARGLNRAAGTFTHTHNLVYGNVTGDFFGTSASTGEISVDPLFVSTSDYHLTQPSPPINTGTNAAGIVDIDFDGDSRPMGTSWDMGCYESVYGGVHGVRILKWLEVP